MPDNNRRSDNQTPRTAQIERRRRKDWVSKSIGIISGIGWVLSIVSLLLLETASPDKSNFFSRFLGAPVRGSWNSTVLMISFVSLVTVFAACALGMVFNILRHRRKSDRFNRSIIILGIASIIGIALFLVRFGSYL